MAIWHLSELLEWLRTHQDYDVPADVDEVAATTKQINLIRHLREFEPRISDEVRRLIV